MIYEMFLVYGVWRSLVARTAGGREVAGSNPVTPIGVKQPESRDFIVKSRLFGYCFSLKYLACLFKICHIYIFFCHGICHDKF